MLEPAGAAVLSVFFCEPLRAEKVRNGFFNSETWAPNLVPPSTTRIPVDSPLMWYSWYYS